MRLHPVTLALLLLAAAARAEEQGGAPLEASKQALKTLQSDQAAKKSISATDKLTDGLPQMQTPLPGAGVVPPDSFPAPGNAQKSEQELKRKKNEQKNWLLDGVERLDREAKGRSRPAGGDEKALPEEQEATTDDSDPDTLLKVYDRQKREEEARTADRQSALKHSDPIAPFLQGWLGNSPAQGKFFDEFAQKPDAGREIVSATGAIDRGSAQGAGSMVSVEGKRGSNLTALQPNPYLAGMEAPSLSGPGGGRLNQSPASSTSTAFGGPTSPPAAPVLDPIRPARPADKKPPLLAPSENEKYFPQLKKF